MVFLHSDEVDCGNPSGGVNNVNDGTINDNPMKDRTFGAVIEYVCNMGFIATPGPNRVCQIDEEWSDRPMCSRADCGSVTPPNNGMITTDPIITYYDSTISFSCDPEYMLNGSSTITCGADEEWSDNIPTCYSLSNVFSSSFSSQVATASVSNVLSTSSVVMPNSNTSVSSHALNSSVIIDQANSGGLSGGGIAGIVITLLILAAVVIATVIVLLFVWKRYGLPVKNVKTNMESHNETAISNQGVKAFFLKEC